MPVRDTSTRPSGRIRSMKASSFSAAPVISKTKDSIELSQKEFALLDYLMRNAERVVTKTLILENVWQYAFDPQTNVVDVLVARLRKKIDRDFDRPLIHTLRGVGYVLREK